MKIKDFNEMNAYLTRPDTKTPAQNAAIEARQKAEDTKRIASKRKEYGLPGMTTKDVVDILNKYEDTPDIILEEPTKKVEKETQYPTQASPSQVARLAYNYEKNRQMTGSDGRYDKAIIKKKKPAPVTSYPKINFAIENYEAFVPVKRTPLQIQQEQNFKKILQEHDTEKTKQKYAGIAGLLGEIV